MVSVNLRMVTIERFKTLALSFPGTIDAPHFDRTAFKVEGKRIYATLHQASSSVNFKFTPQDQSIFCEFDTKAVYPVPNKWGEQGWTTVELSRVPEAFIQEALETAYQLVFNKK